MWNKRSNCRSRACSPLVGVVVLLAALVATHGGASAQFSSTWRGGMILWRQVNPVLPNTVRIEFDLLTAWDASTGAPAGSSLSISTFACDSSNNPVGAPFHSLTLADIGTTPRPGFLGVRITSWEAIESNFLPTNFVWVHDRFTFQLNFPAPSVPTTYQLRFTGCCRPQSVYSNLPTGSSGPFALTCSFRPSLSGTVLTSGEDIFFPPGIFMSRDVTVTTPQSVSFPGLQFGETDGVGARTWAMTATAGLQPTDLGYLSNPTWSSLTTVPTLTWAFTTATSFGNSDPLVGSTVIVGYTYQRWLGSVLESAIPFEMFIYRRSVTTPDVRVPVCPSSITLPGTIQCTSACPPSDTTITWNFNSGKSPLPISPLLGVPMLLRPINQQSADASPPQSALSEAPGAISGRTQLLTVFGGTGLLYPITTTLAQGTSRVRTAFAGLTALAVFQQVVNTNPITTGTFGYEFCITRQPLACGATGWPTVVASYGSCTSSASSTTCADKNLGIQFDGSTMRGNGQYVLSFPGTNIMPVVTTYTSGAPTVTYSATSFKQQGVVKWILSDPLGCYITGSITTVPQGPAGGDVSISDASLSNSMCYRSGSASVPFTIGNGWTSASVTVSGLQAPGTQLVSPSALVSPYVVSNLLSGPYTLTISLAGPAGAAMNLVSTFTISGPSSPLSVQVVPNRVDLIATCPNNLLGVVIAANPTGGMPPYTYAWSYTTTVISTSQVFVGSVAAANFPNEPTTGSLKLVVTDAAGCMFTTNARVGVVTQPSFSLVSVTPPTANDRPDGQVILSVGGATGVTIEWSTECTTPNCGAECVPANAFDTTCTNAPQLLPSLQELNCLGRYDLPAGTVRAVCRIGFCYCNPPALLITIPQSNTPDNYAVYTPKRCMGVPTA